MRDRPPTTDTALVARRTIPLLFLLCLLGAPAVVAANTSHAGWPAITGVLLMNKRDQSRPLDARPGHDPFDNSDPSYSCDGVHGSRRCVQFARLARLGHNELLGGHGDNTIYAGPSGDVIWGDYKPSGDPTTQVNHLYGGPGDDFIYAAHGTNYIWTGGGTDVVHAHFGGGEIHCDSPTVTVYLSHMSRPHYKLFGCEHISYKTLGY